jgi:hypothetical protein
LIEIGILGHGHGAGKRLEEVMVGVDQAGDDDHAARINDLVCLDWKAVRRSNTANDVIRDKDAAVCPLLAGVIHRCHQAGVLDK